MAEYRWIEGGVTAPRGYRAAGVASGIKPSGKPDLTLVLSEVPAVAAGSFTTNLVQAASVVHDRNLLARRQTVRAIVVNSGNANAATGEAGVRAVRDTVALFARLLEVEQDDILVASTGIIGVPLPVEKIRAAAPMLLSQASEDGSDQAAQAILTTDLAGKQCAISGTIGGRPVRLGGIAKGSGMIHPQMATMLAFVTTDCAVEPGLWRLLVQRAVDRSFNQITVDGDSSTNDLLLALANGQAGNIPLDDPHGADAQQLEAMLTAVCADLARKVARDGEGATKLIEIQVRGACNDEGARRIARTVAGSSLVKAAMFGNDPNWGRIVSAAGMCGARFDPDRATLSLQGMRVFHRGRPVAFSARAVSGALGARQVRIDLDCDAGRGVATVWTCDFSKEYVSINADYHT